eukprot:15341039-Ditylum_brightwellii.AAC.2
MAGAKICMTGTSYCASKPNPHNYMAAPYNAPILVEYKALKSVVSSTMEAEYGGLFHNGQMAMGICNVLEAMGHMQGLTHVKTDNKTANSFVHTSMCVKRSKLWDMRWRWLQEASTRKTLKINDNVDYFSKHHPPAHHRIQCKHYILKVFIATQVSPTFMLQAF